MVDLEDLEELAYKLKIKITYENLEEGLLGLADTKERKIKLDISLKHNQRKKKSVLGEEIGHILYPPRAGHITYHSEKFYKKDFLERNKIKNIVAQDERRALDWATNVLVTNVEYNRIKANSTWELTEHFQVENWIIHHKISYLRRKAKESGKKISGKDILKKEVII